MLPLACVYPVTQSNVAWIVVKYSVCLRILSIMPILTYSMVQSPSWTANWFAASQEIPRISRNPKFHYRSHKRPPLSLSWARPIQSIYPHPSSWRSILILSTHLRLGLPSGLFLSGFPTKTLCAPLSSPIRATCPAHLILLDFITRSILGEEYRGWVITFCKIWSSHLRDGMWHRVPWYKNINLLKESALPICLL